MKQQGKNNQGFTLIETIAVIMLVGIISAVLGLAIVQGAKSYVFARSNVSISQKAQLAVARIERELQAITAIDSLRSGNDCIRYKRETANQNYRTIGWNENENRLEMDAAEDADCPVDGNILIGNVADFLISYEPDGVDDLENLHTIDITLTVTRADSDRTETFDLVVNPRNNGRLNAPGSTE
ncbi:MAG: type II secretion system protein J [Desulfobacterales bacterium]